MGPWIGCVPRKVLRVDGVEVGVGADLDELRCEDGGWEETGEYEIWEVYVAESEGGGVVQEERVGLIGRLRLESSLTLRVSVTRGCYLGISMFTKSMYLALSK